MFFLVKKPYAEVKAQINFPCRIAGNHEETTITTHRDHNKAVRDMFPLLERAVNDFDFDYKAPQWLLWAMGDPAHLQRMESAGVEFATFTDGVYCLSQRGEVITLTA